MRSKTLLTALFLLSMGSIVGDEQIEKLMADLEQIKQQMVELQGSSKSQELKEQIAKLTAQIDLLHEMALKQTQQEIAVVQGQFAAQLEAIKDEIAAHHQSNSQAFQMLITTLDAFQNKYFPETNVVAYEENAPAIAQEPVIAQEEQKQPAPAPMPSPAPKKEREMGCATPYHAMNVGVRHDEARGVGYKQGYTTLEGFFTSDGWSESTLPFLDLRFHVFNNGRLAGNAGLGVRSLLTSINHYFGVNAYYDVRHIGGLTVNQVGPGLELLGKRMEYRINGYFPVARKRTTLSHAEFDEFEGNSLILKRRRKIALSGIDGEVGIHFLQSSSDWDLYAGGTPYFLWRSDHSTGGGKLRLKGAYKQYITLEVTGTYDRFFKYTIQGNAALRYPFGPKPKRKGGGCSPSQEDDLLVARVTEYPYRFEIPMIKNQRKRGAAIDPTTGDPYVFWFVDNTSSSAGTFESPFPTLLAAQNASAPNDVIYVFPGDGTTNGMNQGITLQTNQKLFGAGIQQTLLTAQGTVAIPAQASASPLLMNTSGTGNVVTLANNNEVSGLNLTPSVSQSRAIFGNNIIGAYVHDNFISGNNNNIGITLNGVVSGIITIANNQMVQTGTSTRYGIDMFPFTSTGLTLSIFNNNISGYAWGMHLFPAPGSNTLSQVNCTIAQNTISNFVTQGIQIFTGAQSIFTIQNNVVNNTKGSNGILCDTVGTPDGGCLIIDGNQVNAQGNPGGSVGITVVNGSVSNSTLNAVVTNNNVSVPANAICGIRLGAVPTNTLCVSVENNVAESVAPAPGFLLQPSGFTGIVNIDSFENNVGTIAPNVGTVNLVPPGTCTCSD